MTDIGKLQRFDAEMRKRFGVRWAVPAPVPPEDRGEKLPEVQPEKRDQLIREAVTRPPLEKKAGTERKETPYDGLSSAQMVAVTQAQEKVRDYKRTHGIKGAGEYHEPEKTKPNRRENEFMLNLMILRNALVAFGPVVRERARRAGRTTWRDIRLMTRLCCKVQDQMLATMPASKDDYYRAYAEHGHYELQMNGPVRNRRVVLISDKYLAAICEAAMENDCCMCMREGNEIGSCLLRQALLEVAPPTEVLDGRWTRCEYREAAGQLIREEEVTV